MRNSSRAGLTVSINDFEGVTKIASISSGSSQGLLLNFDWGAGDEFADSVRNVFSRYIIR